MRRWAEPMLRSRVRSGFLRGLGRELVAAHEFAECVELLLDDLLAGVVNLADNRETIPHCHWGDYGRIEIFAVQQVGALARGDYLNVLAPLGGCGEENARRSRM